MKSTLLMALGMALGTSLLSCSTVPTDPAATIVNLGPHFRTYLQASQGQGLAEKQRFWEELIEKPDQLFYDSVVWDRYSNPGWQERRKRVLAAFLPKYESLAPKMVTALWAEGLATYVSGLLNPDESDESLLMDRELGRVPPAELTWLAREFLKHARKISLEAANAGTVRSWFSSGREKLRPGLPDRCGYLLGLEVARRLAKNYTVLEMTAWNPQEAEVLVRETLEKMSR